MAKKATTKTMSKQKTQPDQESQIAKAYILSFPQMMVWAVIFAFFGGLTAFSGFAATRGNGSCTITPAQVSLDQTWNITVTGLPKAGVNQVITFPDGGQSTGPVTVNSDGTFTGTGNSNMSANLGFIAPEQVGTYKYQFVGKVKWPAGTYTQTYAVCTVSVM